VWTMRRDGDLDPRLVVERRAARGRRLRRMALPCVFVGQLLLFVTYVYCSSLSEERPRHSQEAPVEQVPPRPPLAAQPARLAADASAPSESAAAETAVRPVAAANAAVQAESATATATATATAAGSRSLHPAVLAAEYEDAEDEEAARRRREDEEDDEATVTGVGVGVEEPSPNLNRTWAALRGRCLEKAKGFWTYQVCVGEGVQQFHTTSSHGVAEQTRARLGFYAAADLATPVVTAALSPGDAVSISQRYTEGDICKLTKVPRETTVHYTCGQTDQLQRVEEPSPCVYELHATVRAACTPGAEGLRDG